MVGSWDIFYALKACLRLQLHGAIYRPDSFVLMLRYCANLKAIRYESTGLNRIVADKSHRVIVALVFCPATVLHCFDTSYDLICLFLGVAK